MEPKTKEQQEVGSWGGLALAEPLLGFLEELQRAGLFSHRRVHFRVLRHKLGFQSICVFLVGHSSEAQP